MEICELYEAGQVKSNMIHTLYVKHGNYLPQSFYHGMPRQTMGPCRTAGQKAAAGHHSVSRVITRDAVQKDKDEKICVR